MLVIKYRRFYRKFRLAAKKISMKKILRRRTEITIETHQTIIRRTRIASRTDCTPSDQTADAPEVLLFSDERIPEPQPNTEGDVGVMDEDCAIERRLLEENSAGFRPKSKDSGEMLSRKD